MVNQHIEIFCFTIDGIQFAVPLSTVDRVIRAVAVSPVPNAPKVIYGIFDYQGRVVAAINLRHRLKLPEQPIAIDHVFILAETQKRKLALVADRADGIVVPSSKDLINASDLDSGFEADGILRRDDGIILIYDIEKFLSASEEIELQDAIANKNRIKN
ncbi:MAG: chemotaxis protein CheW [Bacteroidota bacterium]